jgi:hypothetical protein
VDSEREVSTPGGRLTVHFQVSHSLDPFRLELIQEVPGTLWTAGNGRLHHLGYWAEDVDATAHTLERAGLPRAASSDSWSYHSCGDFYVEILDAARRPATEEKWDRLAEDAGFSPAGTSGSLTWGDVR